MTLPVIPLCESCARLGPRLDGGDGLVCAAFPDGIPDAIYMEGYDHRHAFPDDGGVRYQQGVGTQAAAALAAYEAAH